MLVGEMPPRAATLYRASKDEFPTPARMNVAAVLYHRSRAPRDKNFAGHHRLKPGMKNPAVAAAASGEDENLLARLFRETARRLRAIRFERSERGGARLLRPVDWGSLERRTRERGRQARV